MRAVAFPLNVYGLDLFSGVVTTWCLHLMAVQWPMWNRLRFQAHSEAVTSQHPGSQLAEICEDYTDMVLFSLRLNEIHIVKILLAVKWALGYLLKPWVKVSAFYCVWWVANLACLLWVRVFKNLYGNISQFSPTFVNARIIYLLIVITNCLKKHGTWVQHSVYIL